MEEDQKQEASLLLSPSLTALLATFADSGTPQRLYDRARAQRQLPETPLLFVPTHLLRLFNSDLEKAQIAKENAEGHLDIHALRVSSVTLADEVGATPKELQEHARHADPRLTFDIYAKKRDPRRAALAERIGEALPAVESATGVHFEAEGDNHESRKLLPEHPLPSTQDENGLYRGGTGPEAIRVSCWEGEVRPPLRVPSRCLRRQAQPDRRHMPTRA